MPLLLHDVGEFVCKQAARGITCQGSSARNVHSSLGREGISLDRRCVRVDVRATLEAHILRRGTRGRRNSCANISRHGV